MRKIVLVLVAAMFFFSANETFAQKKKPCKNLFADLEKGTINKVDAKADMD